MQGSARQHRPPASTPGGLHKSGVRRATGLGTCPPARPRGELGLRARTQGRLGLPKTPLGFRLPKANPEQQPKRESLSYPAISPALCYLSGVNVKRA